MSHMIYATDGLNTGDFYGIPRSYLVKVTTGVRSTYKGQGSASPDRPNYNSSNPQIPPSAASNRTFPEHSALLSTSTVTDPLHNLEIRSILYLKKQTMGQYWLVVSPSRREYTTQDFGGKLSELLFSSWPNILCDLIENEWAGNRLICIGDYLNPTDLPASIQQDDLHIYAESDVTPKSLSYGVVQEDFEQWSYEEEETATPSATQESVNRKNRVLRNLTTSQYVLEAKLQCGITLGHIVLMRISWSSESSTGIPGGEYLTKGDWAGHEFDIVDAGMLEVMDGEWEDVTEDTRDEVQDLWSGQFEKGWEFETRN